MRVRACISLTHYLQAFVKIFAYSVVACDFNQLQRLWARMSVATLQCLQADTRRVSEQKWNTIPNPLCATGTARTAIDSRTRLENAKGTVAPTCKQHSRKERSGKWKWRSTYAYVACRNGEIVFGRHRVPISTDLIWPDSGFS